MAAKFSRVGLRLIGTGFVLKPGCKPLEAIGQ